MCIQTWKIDLIIWKSFPYTNLFCEYNAYAATHYKKLCQIMGEREVCELAHFFSLINDK